MRKKLPIYNEEKKGKKRDRVSLQRASCYIQEVLIHYSLVKEKKTEEKLPIYNEKKKERKSEALKIGLLDKGSAYQLSFCQKKL